MTCRQSKVSTTRAGVYETLCPQHMLVTEDNLETRLLKVLYKLPTLGKGDNTKGNNSIKYSQNFRSNQVICIMYPNSMFDIITLAQLVL